MPCVNTTKIVAKWYSTDCSLGFFVSFNTFSGSKNYSKKTTSTSTLGNKNLLKSHQRFGGKSRKKDKTRKKMEENGGGNKTTLVDQTYVHEAVKPRSIFDGEFFTGTGFVFFYFVMFRNFFVAETQSVALVVSLSDSEKDKRRTFSQSEGNDENNS